MYFKWIFKLIYEKLSYQKKYFPHRGKPVGEHSDPSVGLLAFSVLRRDLQDPNPSNRATAVTTICSLKVLAKDQAVEGK